MTPKLYKSTVAGVMVLLIVASSFLQSRLLVERHELGLDTYTELKGAPPMLALTTVALGGFRGLISNALWMRASDLQEDDKYFEMVQLADWITKLEPHFTQVWVVQAWNMAYNISVKFKDPMDRWRWVQRGIELLRDEGLKYNPNDVLMHRELAWFFQHKMGQNLDDAHMVYKQQWGVQMMKVLGLQNTSNTWQQLINPSTPDEKAKAQILTGKLKMDPAVMRQLDEQFGPLEWRLPESSAIYWAWEGLEAAKRNERVIDTNDLITLRRVIYQSMQISFQRGRLIMNKSERTFEFGPNLAIIPKVSDAYEQAMIDDPKNKDHIQTAHRNFLRDAVYFLYTYNHEKDALKWYKYLGKLYPDKPVITGHPESLPSRTSLDQYALGAIQDEMNSMGRDKAEAIIEGMEARSFESLILDDDDHFNGLQNLAQRAWASYQSKAATGPSTTSTSTNRITLRPLNDIRQVVLDRLLTEELTPEMGAILRTKLNLPPPAKTEANAGETNSVPDSKTNSVPQAVKP